MIKLLLLLLLLLLSFGLASGPKAKGSCVSTQFSWVLLQDPRFLGLKFLNIIICAINIIIYIIIESINMKHSIICVINIIICFIINSINMKNIIICVINIIIFIIINIINKIINKFEKTLLLILKNNHRFDIIIILPFKSNLCLFFKINDIFLKFLIMY